jgi:hypothetical protein
MLERNMEIQLSQGKVALVDEEDKDLAEKKWQLW